MDVRLSPEQQALRDSVVPVVDRLGPQSVGQLDDVERAEKLDAAVAASGWRELRAPEEDGAPLASAVEAAIVAEELARGLADAPFVGPTLAVELRRLAKAPSATSIETVAFARDLGALDNAALAIDAGGAESAIVLIEGDRLGAVALTEALMHVDLTRPSVHVDASGATALTDASPLTDDDITRFTALGLALACADLVGAMRGAVRLSCEYAAARQQYGVAVGSFQAVQHLLADAHVATEGSRSTALHAAWAVDALSPGDALAAAAGAKAYCARAARSVCETAIQVHGGIGNTWECMAHVFLRRTMLSSDLLGGVGANLERVLAHAGIGADDGLR